MLLKTDLIHGNISIIHIVRYEDIFYDYFKNLKTTEKNEKVYFDFCYYHLFAFRLYGPQIISLAGKWSFV